jgi:crotonobetainyl-CoA:carnitine CoA-transferase CaiB-like acyl-CoA transferase
MERLGLDYDNVRAINPGIVYGSISGYGSDGPWATKPGQDLLAQSVSGLPWVSGPAGGPPIAVGLSIADLLASCHLALGITALLVRRQHTGIGGLVETSLLEGMLDLQFELLTAFFSEPDFTTRRVGLHGANAYLSAPYGVYPTKDGYLAIAMNPVTKVGEILGLASLADFDDPNSWMDDRDAIAKLLGDHLVRESTAHWLSLLEPADLWCAPVLTLEALAETEQFDALHMMQEITRDSPDEEAAVTLTTTRSPLRVDRAVVTHRAAAPRLGEHSDAIRAEVARRVGFAQS